MQAADLVAHLKSLGTEHNRAGMARFGINTERAFGVSINAIRKLAKQCGRNRQLAADLWATGYHEARILASIVDDPLTVTPAQMEAWVVEFNSWDLCDQCCGNLFDRTPHAWKKVIAWSRRKPEFQKRAAFALTASLARHDRLAPDAEFLRFLPIIEKQSSDNRNYVRKAVKWALREIGKRNDSLRPACLASAERIAGNRRGLTSF